MQSELRPIWFRNFRRTFWFPQKEPKWLLPVPDTFLYLKIYKNVLWTPLGKLTALPRPPRWTWRSLIGGEGKERIRKVREWGKREEEERGSI